MNVLPPAQDEIQALAGDDRPRPPWWLWLIACIAVAAVLFAFHGCKREAGQPGQNITTTENALDGDEQIIVVGTSDPSTASSDIEDARAAVAARMVGDATITKSQLLEELVSIDKIPPELAQRAVAEVILP